MKYKLLSVRGKSATNIGDYVQALASLQFLPRVDGFVNREELSDYSDEESLIIMNGWFMHNPEKWPPSEKLHPLFVAFHLNSSVSKVLLTPNNIEYFKQHEPIGCRDTNTVDLLKSQGVDAYFSGCLTLTLGNKYSCQSKDNTVYFVDPIIPRSSNLFEVLKNSIYAIFNYKDTGIVMKKLYKGNTMNIKRRIISAGFLRLYSRVFLRDDIINAEFLTQEAEYYKTQFHSDEERLQEAERLVRLYAKARFVVTRRIHCALPCLGLNTPVVFLKRDNDSEISRCRFGGLIDLFNVVECGPKKMSVKFDFTQIIGGANIPQNKELWKKYANDLNNRCIQFVTNSIEK